MHGRYVCQFGIIHSQCRCMKGHNNVILIECDSVDSHRILSPDVNVSLNEVDGLFLLVYQLPGGSPEIKNFGTLPDIEQYLVAAEMLNMRSAFKVYRLTEVETKN